MEGNTSVYQVNPVSRITGEGRAEFLRTWGPEFDQKGAGRGGGGGGDGWGRSICAWKRIYIYRSILNARRFVWRTSFFSHRLITIIVASVTCLLGVRV